MADALFDTTVLVDYYNGDQAAARLLLPVLTGASTAAYSPITSFELWLGIATHDEEMYFVGILDALEEAPLVHAASRRAAIWLRGMSPRRAESLFRDALIAATAAERGEPIITRNVRDFTRFYPNVESY